MKWATKEKNVIDSKKWMQEAENIHIMYAKEKKATEIPIYNKKREANGANSKRTPDGQKQCTSDSLHHLHLCALQVARV